MKLAEDFWKSKTTWTAFGGIVTALGLFFAGVVDLPTTAASIFVALQTAFLRDAQAKGGAK